MSYPFTSSRGSISRAEASLRCQFFMSSEGSTSNALASLWMVTGYTLPPRSALEMVFFDTPERRANSSIVQTRFVLSVLSVSTFSSIPKFLQSLAVTGKKVENNCGQIGKKLVKWTGSKANNTDPGDCDLAVGSEVQATKE